MPVTVRRVHLAILERTNQVEPVDPGHMICPPCDSIIVCEIDNSMPVPCRSVVTERLKQLGGHARIDSGPVSATLAAIMLSAAGFVETTSSRRSEFSIASMALRSKFKSTLLCTWTLIDQNEIDRGIKAHSRQGREPRRDDTRPIGHCQATRDLRDSP